MKMISSEAAMIVLGLTGSVGMGKSTTAGFFQRFGITVFDADRCVHELYSYQAIVALEKRFPEAVTGQGIDRKVLSRLVVGDPKAISDLEEIIHPLVAIAVSEFLKEQWKMGANIVVLDIPLLFESEMWRDVDVMVVVSAPVEVQRNRVLSRPGMDEEKFLALLRRQLQDEEKRHRAHFVVRSEYGIESASRQVRTIVKSLVQMNC
jgi:dephospho-CoA kinase